MTLRPTPAQAQFAYRVAFLFGSGLFVLSVLAGLSHEIVAKGRLPGLGEGMWLGATEAAARGDHRRAAREYKMIVFLNSSQFPLVMHAARGLALSGDVDAALDAFRHAERLRPRDAAIDLARGDLLRQHGHFDAAQRSFRNALEKVPDHAAALAGVGETFLDQDRYPDAIRYLTRSVAIRPSAAVHNSLGIAYALSGDPRRAVDEFERVSQLAPEFDVAANLARARAAARSSGARP